MEKEHVIIFHSFSNSGTEVPMLFRMQIDKNITSKQEPMLNMRTGNENYQLINEAENTDEFSGHRFLSNFPLYLYRRNSSPVYVQNVSEKRRQKSTYVGRYRYATKSS